MTGGLFAPSFEAGGAAIIGPFRFSLFRQWDPSKPWAAWLMCNPSTADATADDPTLRRVAHFSRKLGAGGARVVNVWPWRSPYPVDLWRYLEAEDRKGYVPTGRAYLPEDRAANLEAIAQAASSSAFRVVAFGAEPPRRHAWTVQQAVERFGATGPLLCLGTNAEGSPLHPLARGKLAIPNDREPVAWTPPWAGVERLQARDAHPVAQGAFLSHNAN